MKIIISHDVEKALAFEMLKRIVLAWDPDFTKVTPAEATEIEQAEQQSPMASIPPSIPLIGRTDGVSSDTETLRSEKRRSLFFSLHNK